MPFTDAKTDEEVYAQICALHKAKEMLLKNMFVQFKTIMDQYKISLQAIKDEAKFLQVINQSEWTSQIQSVKQNMRYSTVFDDEINLNTANEHNILFLLQIRLRRLDFSLSQLSDERLHLKIE